MTNTSDNVVALVRDIVEPLIDDPQAAQVSSYETEEGELCIEIRVSGDDAGKVIGRQGRIIKAIRVLARAAYRGGTGVNVELIEDSHDPQLG